jgi:threonine aldolase
MIDLRSDTVTKPDDAMREAARDAAVGDDVYGEDPTVNELQDRVADVLDTGAALLVPSGTMGNQVAVRTHAERGVISPDRIAATADAAHELGVPVHLDGARLFNAAVAHDVSAADYAEHVTTVMCCLSKGLGAPVGSMLAGPEPIIEEARHHRKLFGGGMRQAGIVAAPGLAALSNRGRLAEDHRRADRLAAGLDRVDGLAVEPPETNIVLVTTDRPAEQVLGRWRDGGVRASQFGEHTIRCCTHWDVTDDDVDGAIDAIRNAS